MRLVMRVSAVGAVGTLLFAAVLAPAPAGRLGAAALQATRASSWWALALAGSAAAAGVLTLSSVYGVPVGDLGPSAVVGFVEDVAAGRAAALVVLVALVVALAGRRCARTASASALLALATTAVVLPALLAGHSAGAADHALAVGSLSVHVISATLWVGGLLALVAHARGTGLLSRAASRFSLLALVCFLATGASGLLSAWVLIGGSTDALRQVPGSGYGWLLLAKTTALVTLGAFGWWHRRRTLPRLEAGTPGAFRRFAAVEVVVMLATVSVAVALAAAPPPAASQPAATASAPARPATPVPADTGSLEGSPGQDMTGHDHGELSVGVLVDAARFHVSAPVRAGQRVTVYNQSTTAVTITADDGSFDAAVPGQTFVTFAAPAVPGDYAFSSRHSARFADVLVVR